MFFFWLFPNFLHTGVFRFPDEIPLILCAILLKLIKFMNPSRCLACCSSPFHGLHLQLLQVAMDIDGALSSPSPCATYNVTKFPTLIWAPDSSTSELYGGHPLGHAISNFATERLPNAVTHEGPILSAFGTSLAS